MQTKVELKDGQVVTTFDVTSSYDVVIKLSPNEARNFKAQLEAVLKSLASGTPDED
jgi:hypothetical protein